MKVYQIGTFLALTTAMVFAFQNCAQQGALTSTSSNVVDTSELQKTMASLRSQITATSAQDLSCQSDQDCVAVAVGAARCGGPTFYVLNSVKSADYDDVLELAAEYKDVETNYMAFNQLVSTCEARPQPRGACQQNRCVISTGL